jgi:hypothetical protein
MKKTQFKLIALAAAVCVLAGCAPEPGSFSSAPDEGEVSARGGNTAGSGSQSGPLKAAAPTSSLDEEAYYTSAQNITLSSATEGAEIWYTTDGSRPAAGTNGTLYQNAISLEEAAVVKAIAVKEGMTGSSALTLVYRLRSGASIKDNMAISAAGAPGVSAAFTAVHAYLQSKTAAALASEGFIQLGDYIDLEGGLQVEQYYDAAATPYYGGPGANGEVNLTNAPIEGVDNGTSLRLIVVGLNSFNAEDPYTGGGNGESAHLVFQFQNAVASHRVGIARSNAGGYTVSELRQYLVGGGGPSAVTGNFYTGLVAAGVPAGILWAPKRYIANGGQSASAADLIEDKIWLPTQREVYGSVSSSYETEQNQARLKYYDGGMNKKFKYKPDITFAPASWWLASPAPASSENFCLVSLYSVDYHGAVYAASVAPAFCVR